MGYNFFTPAPQANPHAAAKSRVNIKMATVTQKPSKKAELISTQNAETAFLVTAMAAGTIMTTHMAAEGMKYRIENYETSPIGKAVNEYI